MSISASIRDFFSTLRRKWKVVLLVLIVLGAIAFFFYKRQTAGQVKITFIQPTRGDITETLDVSGVVDAKEKASLRFLAGGKLVAVNAKEGDPVRKFQTIAKIDTADLQKKLQQNLNSYFNERMDFEQAQADRRDIGPTDALGRVAQQDQKNLENTVLTVEIQQIGIRNASLISPFDGILVSSPSNVTGVNLLSTDAFEVVNPGSLVFRATVDQADVAKVKKGLPVDIQLDPYPDDTVNSNVNYVAFKSSQTSTGTVYVVEMPIEAATDSAQILEKYRLGMNGDAKIQLAKKSNVLKIPLNATIERDGKTYVKVKTGEKNGQPQTAEKEIQVGIQTEEEIEVVSGVSEQDQVVLP